MSFYTLALFAHILGVLGVFIGIALDWATTLRLRRARTVALVREVTSLVGFQARLIQISALLLLVAGIYMTATAWSRDTPWIVVSLAALIVMGGLSGGVNGRRLAAIRKAAGASSDAVLPPALQRRVADPVLLIGVQTALMVGLGALFLMTTKPDWPGALMTLAVAVVLGVLSAQRRLRPREARGLMKKAQPDS
ncbi:MAG TPA: DUF2269 family protein [Ktedonobacterales bacterium]